MNLLSPASPRRRSRSLAQELVDAIGGRIREGTLKTGDKLPTEAAIMEEFEVSRTVVREAISRMQAAGLVETRHGIGTFVLGPGDVGGFKIGPEQLSTLRDVVAVLELRLGVETEAAALAAARRTDENLRIMRSSLDDMTAALEAGRSTIPADLRFHQEVARATQNEHFAELMNTLGDTIIPRARLEADVVRDEETLRYLRRICAEHENIFDAIQAQDPDAARAAMRTHLANGRERRRRAEERLKG